MCVLAILAMTTMTITGTRLPLVMVSVDHALQTMIGVTSLTMLLVAGATMTSLTIPQDVVPTATNPTTALARRATVAMMTTPTTLAEPRRAAVATTTTILTTTTGGAIVIATVTRATGTTIAAPPSASRATTTWVGMPRLRSLAQDMGVVGISGSSRLLRRSRRTACRGFGKRVRGIGLRRRSM